MNAHTSQLLPPQSASLTAKFLAGAPRIARERQGVPEGIWLRCDGCQSTLYAKDVEDQLGVCPACRHHFPISARERIDKVLDQDSFEEWFVDLRSVDPLGFQDARSYPERVRIAREETGLLESAVVGTGRIQGRAVVLAVTDARFLMGSLGSVVGEKLTRSIEEATRRRVPLILICGSAGARLHEGALSLMQMAKIAAALARHAKAGGLTLCVLTHPTLGGAAAGLGFCGDIILAEPKALIGYTAPRIIAQFGRAPFPAGFQTSEFLLDHGFIDRIVPRPELRATIARMIDYLG